MILDTLDVVRLAPGSPLEKLKTILDKQIAYTATDKLAPDVINEIKDKAGLDIMLRMSGFKNWTKVVLNVSVTGELTFPVWIDLVLDEVNSKMDEKEVFEAYVRDYGLLITPKSKSPKDALTLREFARQVRAEKAKAEPKK